MKRCPDCRRYSNCAALCKRAEKFVNQDHISQRELLVGVAYYQERVWPETVDEYTKPIFTREQWKTALSALGRNIEWWKPLQRISWIRKAYESLPQFSS